MHGPEERAPTTHSVLVVDDDVMYIRALTRSFGALGIAAQHANTLERGMHVFSSTWLPELARGGMKRALAVVDLRLPDGSGVDLIARMVAAWPTLPVIAMTAHAQVPLVVEAMRAGARNVVEKPSDARAILEASEAAPRAPGTNTMSVAALSLSHATHTYIRSMIAECGGNISEAARRLGIHRRSLQRKLGKNP